MLNIRQIKLVNKLGQIWSFNELNNYFAFDINGLGVESSNTYNRVNNFYSLVDSYKKLTTISFNLVFKSTDAYDNYKKFTDFVFTNGSEDTFKLIYVPPYTDTNERKDYFIVCNINKITKTEIVDGYLVSQVIIEKLSNWRLEKNVNIIINLDQEGFTYPFTYEYNYGSSASGEVNVTSNSQVEVPLEIELYGPAKNPELLIFQNDVLIYSMQVFEEIDVTQKIVISSDPSNQYINKVSLVSGDEVNIYQLQDFTKENFLFLPIGSSMIQYKNEILVPGKTTINYNEEFISI